MQQTRSIPVRGIVAAFSTPIFLGMAPIFGKLAIRAGADPFSVAALRTTVAVALLWLVYVLFFRKFIFIYPAGLLGCVVIGIVNGIGSLFYYSGLGLLDASLVQLINGMYLIFALMLSRIGGEKIGARTVFRVGLAMIALIILTGFGSQPIDWLGVGFMLGSALMFAGTVILSQYVLFEMPSPTAALYILSTMNVVVVMVWLATSSAVLVTTVQVAWLPIVALGLTTALSRLAMFAGVKFLGSLQTAIIAITEIGMALLLAFLVLGETLTMVQWVGVGVLGFSMLLVRSTDLVPRTINPGAIMLETMNNWQFQRIAFHRAFGTSEQDSDDDIMSTVTTQEMIAIRKMMGANEKATDPFPIWKTSFDEVALERLKGLEPDEGEPVPSDEASERD